MGDPQRLITSCGDEVRKLVDTEKRLRVAMTELRSNMARLDNVVQEDKEWSDLDKVNSKIQEDAHRAAVQLSAAIEMYLSLHHGVTEDDIGDAITELNALKKKLSEYPLDQTGPLGILLGHAMGVCSRQCQAVQERNTSASQAVETANTEVSALQKEVEALITQTAAVGKSQPSKTSAGTPNDGQKVAEAATSKSETQTVQQRLAQAKERQTKAQGIKKAFEGTDYAGAVNSMNLVVDCLKQEAEQMKALPELRMQLLNEVTAYIAAFEGLRTYPGAERKTALQNMQARVSSTALAWKGVVGLLTNEYAKGQK